jgi:hypothetical protein
MTQTINNLALIQAVRASQIRRNEVAENERKRNYARDIFVRYFSKFSNRKAENGNELVTGRL